jgi:hypothetical protein
MRLIYASSVNWDSFTQRPHEMASYFHRATGGPVLWIDPYPTRVPKFTDILRLKRKSLKTAARPKPDWLQLCRPIALPIDPLPIGPRINRSLYWGGLKAKLVEFASESDVIVGIGKPSPLAISVLEALPKATSFYDAMDDFPEFYQGLSRTAMSDWENSIIAKVGKVLVSSTQLRNKFLAFGIQACPILNACNTGSLPPLQERVPHPPFRLGYVGTIGSWFDWGLVRDLTTVMDDIAIEITGPIFSQPPSNLPKNISLLPECTHADALKRMLDFDVALIPFLDTRLTHSVDPIKYYEYRAMGLPVLSSAFGEMRFRQEESGVFLLCNKTDYLRSISAALAYRAEQGMIERFREENSWSRRFCDVGLFSTPESVCSEER